MQFACLVQWLTPFSNRRESIKQHNTSIQAALYTPIWTLRYYIPIHYSLFQWNTSAFKTSTICSLHGIVSNLHWIRKEYLFVRLLSFPLGFSAFHAFSSFSFLGSRKLYRIYREFVRNVRRLHFCSFIFVLLFFGFCLFAYFPSLESVSMLFLSNVSVVFFCFACVFFCSFAIKAYSPCSKASSLFDKTYFSAHHLAFVPWSGVKICRHSGSRGVGGLTVQRVDAQLWILIMLMLLLTDVHH